MFSVTLGFALSALVSLAQEHAAARQRQLDAELEEAAAAEAAAAEDVLAESVAAQQALAAADAAEAAATAAALAARLADVEAERVRKARMFCLRRIWPCLCAR